MDKKRFKDLPADDLKGFEEFVEGQSSESHFLPRAPVSGTKKETSFEHFTFLSTDAVRLARLNSLLNEKLPFAAKYEQGAFLLREQKEEIVELRKKIFEICDKDGSAYRKSLQDIFDSYFDPHRP